MNLAFISRHAPTHKQVALAAEQSFTLHHVGDADAFTVDATRDSTRLKPTTNPY